MDDIDYRTLYTHLFDRITIVAEILRGALEGDDMQRQQEAMLRAVAELTGAQCDAEDMLLSQV